MRKSKECPAEIQAYKLYIKESLLGIGDEAIRNKPERKNYFIIQLLQTFKNGFELNRSIMDKLINSAKENEFKFINNDSFTGISHGKSLAYGLNNLEHDTSLEHLIELAYLLGLINYDEFITSAQMDKFEQRVKEIYQKDTKKRQKILGVYKGYYLDRHFANKESKALRTLLLNILSSGKVLVDDGEAGHTPQHGNWFFTNNGQIMIINGDDSFDDSGPRYHVVIKLPPENDFSELEGIVGGYSKNNIPFTTLIKFIKLEYDNIDQAKVSKDAVRNFTLDKQAAEEFKIEEGVIDFFVNNSFDNSPHVCLSRELKLKFKDEKFKHIAGLYFMYSSSSMRKGIIQYPVLINKDGTVVIKVKEQEKIKGKMKLYPTQNFLIMDFISDYVDGPFMGAFLFYIDNIKGGFSPGVSIRINREFQPQAKREYIIQSKIVNEEGRDFEVLINKFEESKFEFFFYDDPIYKDLKGPYANIDSLFGREYNLIIETRDTTNTDNILQREKFDKLYLNQSLLEYLKARKKISVEVKYFLNWLWNMDFLLREDTGFTWMSFAIR